MSILFTILFKKNNGDTFSATFNNPIKLTCKLKYLDLDGTIHDLKHWNRTLNKNSITTHIIHDATEIPTITPAPTPAPTPYPPPSPNLCSSDMTQCKTFLNKAKMSFIAHQCCSTNYEDGGCNTCLNTTARWQHYITNSYNNYEFIGTSISIDKKLTILLKDNNLVITDGANAALILLDSSNNTYIDSKLYEQQQKIEDCTITSFYECPQIFSKSNMSELDQSCCSFSYQKGCNICLEKKAPNLGITYQFNILSAIGTSIYIDELQPTVILNDKYLVITDSSNSIAVELSLNL